jgi:choline dehydrogenase
LARSPDLAPLFAGELTPGDAVADDSALAAFIAANMSTYYHPSSTAPMGGPGDPQAVTDPVGAVMGTSGLRVVDASIIPETPSTVLNLTVMMLAERIYQRVYQA